MIELTYPSPSIVMIGGVPGSGKSTFVEKCAPHYAEIISADDARGVVQVSHGFDYDDFRKELIPEARKHFFWSLGWALDGRRNIVLDAAYLTAESRQEILDFTQGHVGDVGYQFHLIMLQANYEDCLKGMQGRERIVPEQDLARYWTQYKDFLQAREDSQLEQGLDTVLTLSRKDCESVRRLNFS